MLHVTALPLAGVHTACHCVAGLGLAGAVSKAAEVAALTWAGSQVTKLGRAAAALAFAPMVDRLLLFIMGGPQQPDALTT